MSRPRAWRRWKNFTKARRKRELDWSLSWSWPDNKSSNPLDFSKRVGFYKNLHQYSKNKIHCSCPICSAKTNNKNRSDVWERGVMAASVVPTHLVRVQVLTLLPI